MLLRMTRTHSATLKLGRAVMHFRDLQEKVAIFMSSKPYGLGPEKHLGDGWIQLTFVVRRRPPLYLGLLAGDAITNANAALGSSGLWPLPNEARRNGIPHHPRPRSVRP